MPIKEMPQFKAVPDRMLEIPQPAMGGLNLRDLEFEQEVNQTPNMMNMMYRSGSFGKRFGQEIHSTYDDKIYACVYYGGDIIVHAGKKIYKYNSSGSHVVIASGMKEESGLFIVYAQTLYYLTTQGLYQYSNNVWSSVTPYVPEVLINCYPNGDDGGDAVDDYNLIGRQFSFIYNGDGTTTTYKVDPYDGDGTNKIIDWTRDGDTGLVNMSVEVNEEPWTQVASSETLASKQYKVVNTNEVEFYSAPDQAEMNVKMTFTMKPTVFVTEKAQVLSCKYYETFGGQNNSRLFLAGCGKSKYFWSNAYDISFFPESNWALLGNTEEDITGFGRQYNILVVFKPRETYSVYSFVETAQTTIVEDMIGFENFKSQLVNARIGCDAPHSIQLVNNLLTWFNSNEGVCTLVSTNIVDERNIRVISRNVDRTNNFGITSILDTGESPINIQSADYNNKYFLAFPTAGLCYMWDYEISPYSYSASGRETPPESLAWFLFDHFYVKQFLKVNKDLLYASAHDDFDTSLIKLTNDFVDLDFDGDGEPDAIHSFYMTPFLQFGSVEMLKNVKNLFIQGRGDLNSIISIYYYTDDSADAEKDPEDIVIGGKGKMWGNFVWDDFAWFMNTWGHTYRRKCNLKKIQMCSFKFDNNTAKRDMNITNIGAQYQLVKYVR